MTEKRRFSSRDQRDPWARSWVRIWCGICLRCLPSRPPSRRQDPLADLRQESRRTGYPPCLPSSSEAVVGRQGIPVLPSPGRGKGSKTAVVRRFRYRDRNPAKEGSRAGGRVGENWLFSDCFGTFNAAFFQWVFHVEQQWIDAYQGNTSESPLLYDLSSGQWMFPSFTSAAAYPSLYDFPKEKAHYNLRATGPRIFVDPISGATVTIETDWNCVRLEIGFLFSPRWR